MGSNRNSSDKYQSVLRALTTIRPGSDEDRADINEAIAALTRLMLRGHDSSVATQSPAQSTEPRSHDSSSNAATEPPRDRNGFAGVSLSELCVAVLKEQSKVLTPGDIVRELKAKGYEFDSVEPSRSVSAALERRAPNDDEIVKHHRGRWAWSGIFDEAKLRAIRHSQRTKEGMARSKKRGGRFGPARKLNEKQMEILLEMARNNEPTQKICAMFDITTKTFYNYCYAHGVYKRDVIKEGKQNKAATASVEDDEGVVLPFNPREARS